MVSEITVTARPHWLNAWLLRPMARPLLLVDGAEHGMDWRSPTTVPAPPGRHRVGVGIRYQGFKTIMGVQEAGITVADGRQVRLKAQNGPLNNEGKLKR